MLAVLVLAALTACAGQTPVEPPSPTAEAAEASAAEAGVEAVPAVAVVVATGPAAVAAPLPAPPANPNFVLKLREVVDSLAEDTTSYALAFIDGAGAGRTPAAPRSEEKAWSAELPEGNHLMRFEVWDSTDGVSGIVRPGSLQPRERFIRVLPGQKTEVRLRFFDRKRRHDFEITREPRAP